MVTFGRDGFQLIDLINLSEAIARSGSLTRSTSVSLLPPHGRPIRLHRNLSVALFILRRLYARFFTFWASVEHSLNRESAHLGRRPGADHAAHCSQAETEEREVCAVWPAFPPGSSEQCYSLTGKRASHAYLKTLRVLEKCQHSISIQFFAEAVVEG
eukprot:560846_1